VISFDGAGFLRLPDWKRLRAGPAWKVVAKPGGPYSVGETEISLGKQNPRRGRVRVSRGRHAAKLRRRFRARGLRREIQPAGVDRRSARPTGHGGD